MSRNTKSYLYSIIAILICIIVTIPYQIIVISCFSTSADIKGNTVFNNLSFDNFMNNLLLLFQEEYFISSLANSFIISITAALIGVLVASMAGYAYAIYSEKYLHPLFLISFSTMVIPAVVILIPTFLIFKTLHLLDTYSAVILTSMSLPFLLYLFKQSTHLFPMELISVARLDGLNEVSIFFRIYLPYMKHMFIASVMIAFFNAWNSVLTPVVLLQSQSKFTNALYLNSLGSFWTADYAVMMLAILLSTLPSLILFLLFQTSILKAMGSLNDW